MIAFGSKTGLEKSQAQKPKALETAGGALVCRPNEEVRSKIKDFMRTKLAEMRNSRGAEGEEERRLLRSRIGLEGSSASTAESNGAKMIQNAPDFFKWLSKNAPSGLACLTGPPASGKTIAMQQIVLVAANDCRIKVEGGSTPLVPVFMRRTLSHMISECDKSVVTLRDALGLLGRGVTEGIFPQEADTVILELFDKQRVLVCIDGLDEALRFESSSR